MAASSKSVDFVAIKPEEVKLPTRTYNSVILDSMGLKGPQSSTHENGIFVRTTRLSKTKNLFIS
tara:strand:+ start:585 stop:776 length:192 start_codon:yes stop_codon:yes gene_type:complete